MLPEQGQSLGSLVFSRASSRRHGAATSSARACHLGRFIPSVDRGYSPAQVATAIGAAKTTRQAVATANAPARRSHLSLATADVSGCCQRSLTIAAPSAWLRQNDASSVARRSTASRHNGPPWAATAQAERTAAMVSRGVARPRRLVPN